MTPQPLFAAFLGGWEIIFILAVFVVLLVVIAMIGAIDLLPVPTTPDASAESTNNSIGCVACGNHQSASEQLSALREAGAAHGIERDLP